MRSARICIDQHTLAVLRELARSQRQPLHTVLNEAVESYRRQRFLDDANAAFAALRDDPKAWSDEQKERGIWHRTAADGLEK